MKTKLIMTVAVIAMLTVACERRDNPLTSEGKIERAVSQEAEAQSAIERAANAAAEDVKADVRRQVQEAAAQRRAEEAVRNK